MASTPPDTLRVRTADNVALGYPVAGLGSRLVAQMLDCLLALALMLAALIAYGALIGTATSMQGATWAALGAGAFAVFVFLGYFFVSELASGGRTLGKSAMGLRVMRLDGRSADVTALAVRNIVRIIDMTGIGVLVMFFHPLSRRLGDLAAGTVVVRERTHATFTTAAAPPPVLLRAPDAGPAVEGIEHLGSAVLDALRTFLSRQGLTPQLRHGLAIQLAERLLSRMQVNATAPERMWPPELFLERVYLQLDARLR